MIVPFAILVGFAISVALQDLTVLTVVLLASVLFHEMMLYDIHRHVQNIEEQLDA